MMTQKQHINMLAAFNGLSQSDIARKLGFPQSTFNKRLLRNTITPEEMEKIAEITGAKYKAVFVLPDGKEI